jgi:ATP-dependent Lon protease
MEIKPEYIKGLKFHYLTDMIDVLDLALVKKNLYSRY